MIKDNKLDRKFFQRSEVEEIARDLIGKYLFTQINNKKTGGIIVETEAYCGETDKASHAYPNKLTKRTSIMFEPGGLTYVYLCYGIHKLFNIVTNQAGRADAILVRAIEPQFGIDTMSKRRKTSINSTDLTSGPGKLTQAMGIELLHYGLPLDGNIIWVEDNGLDIEITTSKRIGVDYAGKDALLPWRFFARDNQWLSV